MVFIDNRDVQTYQGALGQWTSVNSTSMLKHYIEKYKISKDLIERVNGGKIMVGRYLFIPFSDEYIQALEQQGLARHAVASAEDKFIWPLDSIDSITSSFGIRSGQLHTGIDLPSPAGTPIVAAMDGRVKSVGYVSGHGNSIFIEHRNNFYSRYSHDSVIFVKRGDFVKKGQVIGLVGSTGNSTGNHLHFEVRYNEIPLNPLDFLPEKESLKNMHLIRNWK